MLVEAEAFYGVGCRALNSGAGRSVCGEKQTLTFENALFNNPTLKNTVLKKYTFVARVHSRTGRAVCEGEASIDWAAWKSLSGSNLHPTKHLQCLTIYMYIVYTSAQKLKDYLHQVRMVQSTMLKSTAVKVWMGSSATTRVAESEWGGRGSSWPVCLELWLLTQNWPPPHTT